MKNLILLLSFVFGLQAFGASDVRSLECSAGEDTVTRVQVDVNTEANGSISYPHQVGSVVDNYVSGYMLCDHGRVSGSPLISCVAMVFGSINNLVQVDIMEVGGKLQAKMSSIRGRFPLIHGKVAWPCEIKEIPEIK